MAMFKSISSLPQFMKNNPGSFRPLELKRKDGSTFQCMKIGEKKVYFTRHFPGESSDLLSETPRYPLEEVRVSENQEGLFHFQPPAEENFLPGSIILGPDGKLIVKRS